MIDSGLGLEHRAGRQTRRLDPRPRHRAATRRRANRAGVNPSAPRVALRSARAHDHARLADRRGDGDVRGFRLLPRVHRRRAVARRVRRRRDRRQRGSPTRCSRAAPARPTRRCSGWSARSSPAGCWRSAWRASASACGAGCGCRSSACSTASPAPLLSAAVALALAWVLGVVVRGAAGRRVAGERDPPLGDPAPARRAAAAVGRRAARARADRPAAGDRGRGGTSVAAPPAVAAATPARGARRAQRRARRRHGVRSGHRGLGLGDRARRGA